MVFHHGDKFVQKYWATTLQPINTGFSWVRVSKEPFNNFCLINMSIAMCPEALERVWVDMYLARYAAQVENLDDITSYRFDLDVMQEFLQWVMEGKASSDYHRRIYSNFILDSWAYFENHNAITVGCKVG